MIGWNGRKDRAAEVVVLVLEGEPAALRIVEAGDALLDHEASEEIVVERIQAAEVVVTGSDGGRAGDRLKEEVLIVEPLQLRNVSLLAPSGGRQDAVRPGIRPVCRNR